jgi:hypothetical protein
MHFGEIDRLWYDGRTNRTALATPPPRRQTNSHTRMNVPRSNRLMRCSQLSRPCLATASALAALTPLLALAQTDGTRAAAATPVFWYLLAAAMAILTAVGLVLIGVAGLERARAWDAALGAVAAIGLATLAYWAIGFRPSIWRCWSCLPAPGIARPGLGVEPTFNGLGRGVGRRRVERLAAGGS